MNWIQALIQKTSISIQFSCSSDFCSDHGAGRPSPPTQFMLNLGISAFRIVKIYFCYMIPNLWHSYSILFIKQKNIWSEKALLEGGVLSQIRPRVAQSGLPCVALCSACGQGEGAFLQLRQFQLTALLSRKIWVSAHCHVYCISGFLVPSTWWD